MMQFYGLPGLLASLRILTIQLILKVNAAYGFLNYPCKPHAICYKIDGHSLLNNAHFTV